MQVRRGGAGDKQPVIHESMKDHIVVQIFGTGLLHPRYEQLLMLDIIGFMSLKSCYVFQLVVSFHNHS